MDPSRLNTFRANERPSGRVVTAEKRPQFGDSARLYSPPRHPHFPSNHMNQAIPPGFHHELPESHESSHHAADRPRPAPIPPRPSATRRQC